MHSRPRFIHHALADVVVTEQQRISKMSPFINEDVLRMVNRHSLYRGPDCPHPKVPTTVEVFAPGGDLMLVVGKWKCTNRSCILGQLKGPNALWFRVDSVILAGASPALGFILYSPSTVAARTDGVQWIVQLADDNPPAFRTFISILYGHHPIIVSDEHMELEHLLHLTILADKYDLAYHFLPWSAQWVQDMEPYWAGRDFARESTEDLESLLWIFWVLGHEPLYTYMILQIAFHCELDAAGQFTDPSGHLCFTNDIYEVPVPPCALCKSITSNKLQSNS